MVFKVMLQTCFPQALIRPLAIGDRGNSLEMCHLIQRPNVELKMSNLRICTAGRFCFECHDRCSLERFEVFRSFL